MYNILKLANQSWYSLHHRYMTYFLYSDRNSWSDYPFNNNKKLQKQHSNPNIINTSNEINLTLGQHPKTKMRTIKGILRIFEDIPFHTLVENPARMRRMGKEISQGFEISIAERLFVVRCSLSWQRPAKILCYPEIRSKHTLDTHPTSSFYWCSPHWNRFCFIGRTHPV